MNGISAVLVQRSVVTEKYQKMATSTWGTLVFSRTGVIGRQIEINCLCDPRRRYRAKTKGGPIPLLVLILIPVVSVSVIPPSSYYYPYGQPQHSTTLGCAPSSVGYC